MSTLQLAHVALLVLLLAVSCAAPEGDSGEAGTDEITGSVTYRERIALPPDAVLHLMLHDLFGEGGEGPVRIVDAALPMEGRSVPFGFRLALDDASVRPGGVYVLTAWIEADGKAEFAAQRLLPALEDGAPRDLSILLRRAEPSPEASLTGTRWRAVEMAGGAVDPKEGRRAPFLVLRDGAGTYMGHGGVNFVRGDFELEGESLRFMPGPTTLMAGDPEAMALEQAFLGALGAATGYRIKGEQLVLSSDAGTVARFLAVPLD
jgi:putative lipoprotein